MSFTYKIENNDTFDLISRKVYGTEINSSLIRRANPGVLEPLVNGVLIIIPDDPNAPKNLPQLSQSNNVNEVTLLIDNTTFRFWDSIRITRSIDSMDTVEFGAPFDSSDETLKKFRQGSLYLPFKSWPG